MCGIVGIISSKIEENGHSNTQKMAEAIHHRGPDGTNTWASDDGKIQFGHNRLSIIDLSHDGDQPMHYIDRYTIVFNGEIYNYLELKETLLKKGYKFKSLSDTEVLMALYHDKRENCLTELDGMFAFCIYDKAENTLFFGRDRFGEKPLYITWFNGQLLFASEMKAFWAIGVPKIYNERMVYNFMAFGYEENPEDKKETFFQNIFRFPAAHYAILNLQDFKLSYKRYWNLEYKFIDDSITLEQASDKLTELLYKSVSRRLRSDVPVGSSLSGGLDSSLIVSMVDRLDSEKQILRKTFSASFPGFIKDEKKYQEMVINSVHVTPHFVYPDQNSMLNNIEKIIYHQEEPFSSPSINAQFEVFELAKKNNVIVLLDGQGADEVFAGYHGYFTTFFNGLRRKRSSTYRKQFLEYKILHENNKINPTINRTIKSKISSLLPPDMLNSIKHTWGKNFGMPEFPFRKEFLNDFRKEKFFVQSRFSSLAESLSYSTTTFGLEQLLRYADRNSMANSREVRLPFLSHELIEFVFTLPDLYKINNGWTKYILRKSASDLLPDAITWRKDKVGYEPPDVMTGIFKKMMSEQYGSENEIVEKGRFGNLNSVNTWRTFLYSKFENTEIK